LIFAVEKGFWESPRPVTGPLTVEAGAGFQLRISGQKTLWTPYRNCFLLLGAVNPQGLSELSRFCCSSLIAVKSVQIAAD
jgi:hypothetical protein